jgi:hypothetical protein
MTEQIPGSGSPAESGRTSPANPAGQPGRGSGEMLAMVLTSDRKTRLERRPVPTPRDDQVLVDIDLCGICGSDRAGHQPRPDPVRIRAWAWPDRPAAVQSTTLTGGSPAPGSLPCRQKPSICSCGVPMAGLHRSCACSSHLLHMPGVGLPVSPARARASRSSARRLQGVTVSAGVDQARLDELPRGR